MALRVFASCSEPTANLKSCMYLSFAAASLRYAFLPSKLGSFVRNSKALIRDDDLALIDGAGKLVAPSIPFPPQLSEYEDPRRHRLTLVCIHQSLYIFLQPRFSRFSASWTTVTAGACSILFVHPTWSTYPLSSLGTQSIWVFVTLMLWMVGAGLLNGAIPSLLVRGRCSGIVYCGHIQSLFGAQTLSSYLTLS